MSVLMECILQCVINKKILSGPVRCLTFRRASSVLDAAIAIAIPYVRLSVPLSVRHTSVSCLNGLTYQDMIQTTRCVDT